MQLYRIPKAFKPEERRAYVLRFLGDVVTVPLHWDGHGNVPCLGRECRHCPGATRRRGYVAAQVLQKAPDQWISIVFEITEGIAGKFDGIEPRGWIASVRRVRLGSGSQISLEWLEHVDNDLPPVFDVRPILLRLWGLEDKSLAEAPERRSTIKFPQSG